MFIYSFIVEIIIFSPIFPSVELCKGMKPVAMTGHFLYTKLCNAKINPGDVLTYDITVPDVELI